MQRSPTPRVRALHVFVLVAFAVAQPLFDLLGRHAEFLIAHGATRGDLYLLTLFLAGLVPGCAAIASFVALHLAGRGAGAVHFAVVALLATAIALPIVNGALAAPAAVLVAGAATVGLATGAAVTRFAAMGSILTVASPLVLVFPLLFLFHSSASRIANPPSPTGQPRPSISFNGSVVVVVFDALPLSSLIEPNERIAATLFPNFAALAERSHWYRNATTVSTHTNFAVPAILSGRYPVDGTLPTASEYPDNLFTALGDDFDFNIVEPITSLCPVELCRRSGSDDRLKRLARMVADLRVLYLHVLLPREWARSLPEVTDAWSNFSTRGVIEISRRTRLRERRDDVRWIFAEFLAGIEERKVPALHFLHINVPHTPYLFMPSGKEYRPTKDHPNRRLENSRSFDAVDADWAEVQALQRHLLQVAYCDALLGQLVERLQRAGLFDDTLLVVTSDHGVSVVPGLESRELTGDPSTENVGDLLPVPLFIKLPGQHDGFISERNVELVDIFPTILDALGAAIPASVEGSSLLATAPIRPQKTALQASDLRHFDAKIETRAVTAVRIHEVFDFDAGPDALFAIGPHRELLGRPVAELSVVAASTFEVRLEDPSSFEAVDLEANFLPLHIVGEIRGPGLPAAGVELVVAVNGTIRASTRSFDEWNTSRFTALVAESALRAGRNDIEVFVVRESSHGIELLATRTRPATTWEAVRGRMEGIAFVISSEGAAIPVIQGMVKGNVRASRGNFEGRLYDVRERRIGDTILMFGGGKFLYAHDLRYVDPATAGRDQFRFVNPYPRMQDQSGDYLHFVGVSSGVGSEIVFDDSESEKSYWQSAATLEIERDGDREGLRVSSGAWFPIEHTPIGDVSLAAIRAETVLYSGRITGPGDPPPAVMIFVDDVLIAPAPILRSTEHATAAREPESAKVTGTFRLELPVALFGDTAMHQVRFFVFSNGRAVELHPRQTPTSSGSPGSAGQRTVD